MLIEHGDRWFYLPPPPEASGICIDYVSRRRYCGSQHFKRREKRDDLGWSKPGRDVTVGQIGHFSRVV